MDVIGAVEVVGVRDDIEPEVTCWREEESIIDKNANIFDTILVGEAIETTRGKLEFLKDRGRDTCGVFKSFFHFFSIGQTPHCPEFVEWCADNFSVTEGVIMNKSKSKILCPIQAFVIRKTLDIPDEFTHISQDYQEEDIIRCFREFTDESKETFLKAYSKPNGEPINLSYPIDLSQFNEENQWCISLAIQFLGLDTDAYIPESLLSVLFILSTCSADELELPGKSGQSCCLKFDDFLAENICS